MRDVSSTSSLQIASSDYALYSTLHLRQPPAHRLQKRVDVVDGLPFHSQKTLPCVSSILRRPQDAPDSRPSHPRILRSSCSLPVQPADSRRHQQLPVSDFCDRLLLQLPSEPSLRLVHRSQRAVLPQFNPALFVQKSVCQLPADEFRKLCVLLEITTASVRSPAIFYHLLQSEIRVLLDPVSQNMDPPPMKEVCWNKSTIDSVSVASGSTSASLNTSLASARNGEECSSGALSVASSLRARCEVAPIVHWQCILNDRSKDQATQTLTDTAGGKWVSRETRHSVVTWMSKVIEAMGWPLNSFFTAVHAMDYSLRKTQTLSGRGYVSEASVPLLSTACVLVGVSAECEHRQLQKARAFVGQVPHVASVKEIVCKQLAVVAGLDRGTLLHKTPLDFIMYYLAAMQLHSPEIEQHRIIEGSAACCLWDKLFRWCIARDSGGGGGICLLQYVLQSSHGNKKDEAQQLIPLIELIIDGCLAISISCYLECIHSFIPMSRIVAATLFTALSIVEESFKDSAFCIGFCRLVFALDYAAELRPVLTDLMPLIYSICSRKFKGARASDKSDATSEPLAISSDSTFTAWSATARILLSLLEDVAAHGPSAFPSV
eukprot:Gregarina_sp_Poly_1__4461@NODE_23_length_20322_cov_242_373192_g21_i0_p5_GENE_NODE_23_length_20322_cov_242_373192_g21_i0NODE_23_length_20322_cov_242_373192_g21_i0_p5_ORF_typecomplete_len603_score82_34Cyclin_N/PF00134_23/0_0012Cyclin_N/PF00134_23/5_2e03_NODE_23_length_20322_cov_242_373192_g21_i055587366